MNTQMDSDKPHANRRYGVFSVYGDFWPRAHYWGAEHLPWFVHGVTITTFTFLFFLLAWKPRRAVARNMLRLRPGIGLLGQWWGTWQVFLTFAWVMTDLARARCGMLDVDWRVRGAQHVDKIANGDDACIIFTAHMGNYDVAAPMFSDRFNRPIHTVRMPERKAELQEIRERDLRKREKESPFFKVHYNKPGGMLGLELTRILTEGGVVAVQADRVMMDVSPIEMPYDRDATIRIPKGPFILQRATQATCYPLFIIRRGWRSYELVVKPPLKFAAKTGDAEEDIRKAAQVWVKTMREVLKDHSKQWAVFEEAFTTSAGREE